MVAQPLASLHGGDPIACDEVWLVPLVVGTKPLSQHRPAWASLGERPPWSSLGETPTPIPCLGQVTETATIPAIVIITALAIKSTIPAIVIVTALAIKSTIPAIGIVTALAIKSTIPAIGIVTSA